MIKTRDAVKGIVLRECIFPQDLGRVREILQGTNVFRVCEVDVALELVGDSMREGKNTDYRFIFADLDGKTAGYVCYGMIPMTDGRFDLYWLAVDRAFQGRGIASLLTGRMEERVIALGGRRVYIDTSSREPYRPARDFYRLRNYREVARLQGYYADGDDKVIFMKNISGGCSQKI
ncbi:MAG: GNAT family N-acetyltransferase [Nitrospiraceae bacterium]|nr:MAG: GNAT family N-acetyltransferase [Nitrospiraceae bacterium]